MRRKSRAFGESTRDVQNSPRETKAALPKKAAVTSSRSCKHEKLQNGWCLACGRYLTADRICRHD